MTRAWASGVALSWVSTHCMLNWRAALSPVLAGILLIPPNPLYYKGTPPFQPTILLPGTEQQEHQGSRQAVEGLAHQIYSAFPVRGCTQLHATKLSGGPPTLRFRDPTVLWFSLCLSHQARKVFLSTLSPLVEAFSHVKFKNKSAIPCSSNSLLIVWKE